MTRTHTLGWDHAGGARLVCRSYPLLCSLVGYILIAAVAAWPVTFGDKTIGPEHVIDHDPFYGGAVPASRSYGDATPVLLDYPRDMAIARSFRSGQLAAWNPWVATGVPLLAEQSGAFFPLRILFYLWPGPSSYTLFRMSRMVLAALGAFALARSRGRSVWASFVAGALLELGGPVLWMLPFAGTSPAFVVPWLLLGVNLLFQRRGRLAAAVTGGAVGLALLGGHPGLAAVTLLSGAVAFLGAALENVRSPRKVARALGWGALAGLLGVLVAACAILPFAELLTHGHSYKETGHAQVILESNLTLSRITWWSGAFAPILVDTFREIGGRYPYTLTSLYGLLTMFLALAATLRGRFDCRLGLVVVVGIALSFAPPGLAWIAHLPGVRNIPSPYAAIMLAVPLTQWAASGIDLLPRIRSQIVLKRPTGRDYGISGRTAAIFLVLMTMTVLCRLSFAFLGQAQRDLIGTAFSGLNADNPGLSYLFVMATIGVAVAWGHRRPAAVGLVLGIAAMVELTAYDVRHFSESVSVVLRRGRPAGVGKVAQLVNQSHARLASNAPIAETQYNMLDEIPDLRIVSALVPKRYYDYMTLLNGGFFTWYGPAPAESPFLDLAAVRFFVLPTTASSNLVPVQSGQGWQLFVNDQAVSRARLIANVEIVDSEEQALGWLQNAALSATHLSQTVLAYRAVIESSGLSPAGKQEILRFKEEPSGQTGTALFVKDEPEQVSIAVQTKTPALLVLADAHYPGWRAQIDGVRTEILPTNVLFRGVLVPAGKHVVRFDYRPLSLSLGLGLSLLGILGIGVLLFWETRTVRRSAHPAHGHPHWVGVAKF